MPSKFIRLALTGLGVIVLLSGLVNLISAITLLEPSDEASLGISRNLVNVFCITAMLCGIALIYLGLRKKK
jgi:hypothetical protein